MNVKELVRKINESKIHQDDFLEKTTLPKEVTDVLSKAKIVERNLDIDVHRWYETSIIVYELEKEFLGIRVVTNIFSVMDKVADVNWILRAYEMKPIETITYKQK